MPSYLKGLVTTPIVKAPHFFAISATTGLAPVPVPPPKLLAIKTKLAPLIISSIFATSSLAASAPFSGSVPAPNPCVTLSPKTILVSALDLESACLSVFIATKSTPLSFSSIILLTALHPPFPTPITFITVPKETLKEFIFEFIFELSANSILYLESIAYPFLFLII